MLDCVKRHLKLYLNVSSLRTVDEERDLGILVDAHLSFKSHINVTVAKAHVRANQTVCCFLSCDPETLVRAFVTYFRPLVDKLCITQLKL